VKGAWYVSEWSAVVEKLGNGGNFDWKERKRLLVEEAY
jgi:hypothetical protein